MGIRFILSKGQGQGQVTKGHDNQRSHLSSVTHVFGAILAIEVDGGVRSIARSHFLELKVKVRSRSGHKRSNFEVDKSQPKRYVSGPVFAQESNGVICFHV